MSEIILEWLRGLEVFWLVIFYRRFIENRFTRESTWRILGIFWRLLTSVLIRNVSAFKCACVCLSDSVSSSSSSSSFLFHLDCFRDDPSWPCCQNGITHQEYLGQIVHAVEKMLTIQAHTPPNYSNVRACKSQSANSVPPHLFSSMTFLYLSKYPIIIDWVLIHQNIRANLQ